MEMPSVPAGRLDFPAPKRIGSDSDTQDVWAEYAQLYKDYKPVHLGQGFADYVVTKFTNVRAEVVASPDSSLTQYARANVNSGVLSAVWC